MDHQQEDRPIEARLVQPLEPQADPEGLPQHSPLLQNKWAVLAILFAVTGFLGLPLLWMNKHFSPAERIFWAIVVTLYTIGLIAGAAAICLWSYRQITGGGF